MWNSSHVYLLFSSLEPVVGELSNEGTEAQKLISTTKKDEKVGFRVCQILQSAGLITMFETCLPETSI